MNIKYKKSPILQRIISMIDLLKINNTGICPKKDQSKHRWCSYEVIDVGTSIVEEVYLVGLLIVIVMYFINLRKLIEYRKIKKNRRIYGHVYIRLYTIIGLWVIFTFIRITLSLVIFYVFMFQDFTKQNGLDFNGPDPAMSHSNVIFASIYTFFDFMCGILINLIIILIPYYWLCAFLLSVKQRDSLTIQMRKLIHVWFYVLKYVKYYSRYIRSGLIIFAILQPILFFTTQFCRCSMPFINYFSMIIQAGIILTFYCLGAFIVLKLKRNQLINMNPQDFRTIKIEYFLLICVTVGRIFLNVYYLFIQKVNYSPNQNCSDRNKENDLQIGIRLFLHHFLMHLVPVFIVLRIYKVKNRHELKQSLLIDELSDSQIYQSQSESQQQSQNIIYSKINDSRQTNLDSGQILVNNVQK